MKTNLQNVLGLLLVLGISSAAAAHDTWVQTGAGVVRVEEAVYVDLMLGNHGNDHRDFKLAGKPDLAASTLEVVLPDGKRIDLKDRAEDRGYAPAEGFWSARFVTDQPGLYLVSHTLDKIVSYAPARSIKSAKTCFVASPTLDKVSPNYAGFERVLGHPFELVFVRHPVTPMGPGTPIAVRLLLRGEPLAGARVSFVPRGETLSEDFDKQFERTTDEKGEASFTPTAGNYYLVVAHHDEPQESGKGYERTKYSASLTVLVPQICPCCVE